MTVVEGKSIKVRVKAFAVLREALGFGECAMEVQPGGTVAQLIQQLAEAYPDANMTARRVGVAVNRAYVSSDTVLNDGDEVALIPPVSGGSTGNAARPFEVTDRPISLDDLAARVIAPDRGGVTIFAGTVRGVTGALETDYLEYEAYPEMAEASFAVIAHEAQARWPDIAAVAVMHRVGRLEIGEVSIAIAVAAAHRRDTFDACHYIIDRIKQESPIWKREVGPDGSSWVEGPESQIG
jgi:molybdopterin synthase catalytic subunit